MGTEENRRHANSRSGRKGSSPSRPHDRLSRESMPPVVKARVTGVRAAGLRVVLPSGAEAWLPGGELYPDFRLCGDFRSRARTLEGTEIDVVQYGVSVGGSEIFVSHIRVTDDPWSHVATWSEGAIKVMQIYARTRVRALGIIPPGVRAEVRLGTLAGLLPSSWHHFERPLPGDEVAGEFHRRAVDSRERVVTLDVASYVRGQVLPEHVLLPQSRDHASSPRAEPCEPADRATANHGGETTNGLLDEVNAILLVDDHRQFRRSLASFLQKEQCEVVACATYEEAVKAVELTELQFDLAIIDVNLETTTDGLGLNVAAALGTKCPECTIVLMSGEDLDPEQCSAPSLADLRVSAFLSKPFGIHDFIEVLSPCAGPKALTELLPGRPAVHAAQLERPPTIPRLDGVVQALRDRISADGVVLFSMHPISCAVEIVAKSDPNGRYSVVKPKLDRSPVRDAAIDGEEIDTSRSAPGGFRAKHRYLLRAYPYESCLGVPVQIQRASQLAYALFAFSAEPNRFRSDDMVETRRAAREMGCVLYALALETELRQMKPFEVMGKVYASMAHELKSILSLDFALQNLRNHLVREDAAAAVVDVDELRVVAKQAMDIVHIFRTMARGQQEAIVEFPVEEAVIEAMGRFQKKANELRISLRPLECETVGSVVRMRRSGLEQIIYNLLLNAAQQTERLTCMGRTGGTIQVQVLRRVDTAGLPWAILLAHDTGPGIHKRDFERVFEIHYTTKLDGCGMGLDICRAIAATAERGDAKGYVRVARSVLLGGTTFEVGLPLA